MTTEEQIIDCIANRIDDRDLHFQIIVQDRILHIYINRNTEEYVDHSELTSTIKEAIAELNELNFSMLELYSRVLGEVEPDWQKSVELIEKDIPALESLEGLAEEVDRAVDDVKSLVDPVEEKLDTNTIEENQSVAHQAENVESTKSDLNIDLEQSAEDSDTAQIDLSQHCFIRNKALLSAELVAPSKQIAQTINTFDKFSVNVKRSQLPLLESYFKNSQEQDLTDVEPDIQSWWTDIMAVDVNAKRKLAIWLSRYCFDPASTIASVETVFTAQAAAQKAGEEQAKQKVKEEREARNNEYLESFNSSNSNSKRSSKNSYEANQKEAKSKPGCLSWLSYAFVLFIIRLLIRVVFVGIPSFQNYVAEQEAVEVNSEILAQYSEDELEQAKKLADLGVKEGNGRNFDAAWQYTEEALEVFPDYARAYYNLATFAEREGYYQDALADYSQAIELYPDSLSPYKILHQAYNNRGIVREKLNDCEGAVDDADEAIALNPDRAGYHANRGNAHQCLRDYDTAVADYTRAIELQPKNAGWYYNRGNAHYRMRNHRQALEDFDRAIDLNPRFARAYAKRSYTNEVIGRHGQAILDAKKAKSLGYDMGK